MSTHSFIKGFSTGLVLQLAIGPVFIYVINAALMYGPAAGIVAVIAVTIADYLYIILAITGAGNLLRANNIKSLLSILSAVVLLIFGLLIIRKGISFDMACNVEASVSVNPVSVFTSTFILTVSNPLTIVFWTGMFTSGTIEYSFGKKDLLVFGLSAGMATPVFLASCVIVLSSVKTMLPLPVFRYLNMTAGFVITLYGISRIIGTFRNHS